MEPTPQSIYHDEHITCADCGGQFTWTTGEQEYYASKGLTHAPKRCKPCRQARRDSYAQAARRD